MGVLRIRVFPVVVVAAPLVAVLVGALPVMGQTPPTGGNITSRGTQGAPGVGVVAPQPPPPSPEFGFEESIPLQQGGLREQRSIPEPNLGGVYAPAFVRNGSGV